MTRSRIRFAFPIFATQRTMDILLRGCFSKRRCTGALLARLHSIQNIVRGVDERNVGKRLREVADQALSCDVVLLRQQANVVANAKQPFKQAPRVGTTSGEHIGVRKPESAGKEG